MEIQIQKILFVDDERQLLNSFERMLMDYDYEVLTAESGKEALEVLEEEENVDLIISDMRMPYMDGYELLSEVKKKYPHIIRVLLSGYADENIIYKALQENVAKLYLLKPWDTSYLIKEIEHIFQTEYSLNSSKISSIVNNSRALFKFNSNYNTILKMIENGADLDTITNEISKDISISTNLIRIANSAFFRSQTGSVKEAIQNIGSHSLYTFLKSALVIESIENDIEKTEFLNKLWEMAFLTNKLCIFMYEKILKKPMPDNYSSAGLLHNIGTVIIIDNYADEYIDILKVEKKPELSLLEREEEFISANHQQIGAYLLDGWDFPYPIVESALYHHDPLNEHIINKEIVSVVHIASHYTFSMVDLSKLSVDMKKYNKLIKINEEAFKIIDIKKEDFEEYLKEFKY